MAERSSRLALKDNPTGQALLLVTLALLVLGVVMVHSALASVVERGPWYARKDVRHTIFVALALLVLSTFWRADYRRLTWRIAAPDRPRAFGGRFAAFMHHSVPFVPALWLSIALLCGVLVFVPPIGRQVGGYYRWIRIGPSEYGIGFQPSELIKVSLLVFLAAWLSRESADVRSFKRTFLPAVILIGLCCGLVVTQDFGTAVMIGLAAGVTLLLAGVPWYYLASLLVAGAGGFAGLLALSPHRLARIKAMFDPWSLTNPCSYQPRQSLLAILTGGVTGKGIGRGIVKQGFLPEGETDFIFSVFCEEAGVIGAALLVGLVLLWIWHARKAAVRAEDRFGRLLVGSLGFLIAAQALLHIAVDTVAVPPTGMGLPFVSAGGTALVTSAAAVGLIISVTARSRRARSRAGDPARLNAT